MLCTVLSYRISKKTPFSEHDQGPISVKYTGATDDDIFSWPFRMALKFEKWFPNASWR